MSTLTIPRPAGKLGLVKPPQQAAEPEAFRSYDGIDLPVKPCYCLSAVSRPVANELLYPAEAIEVAEGHAKENRGIVVIWQQSPIGPVPVAAVCFMPRSRSGGLYSTSLIAPVENWRYAKPDWLP